MEEKIVTYEQVEQRIKNKPIEEWTKEDVFDRYIAYGTEEEINTPKIQQVLLQHGYIKELFEMTNFIKDEQVISDILHKYLHKVDGSIIIFGKVRDIWIIEHLEEPKERKLVFDFIDTDTNEIVTIVGTVVFTQEELDDYLKQLNKYKNNLIALVIKQEDNKNTQYALLSFLVNTIFKNDTKMSEPKK